MNGPRLVDVRRTPAVAGSRWRPPPLRDEDLRPERSGVKAEPPWRSTPWARVEARPAPFGPSTGPLGRAFDPAAVLSLQRVHGNAHVLRLLAVQRCGATPCGCSADERVAHAAQKTMLPEAPPAMQRQAGSGEDSAAEEPDDPCLAYEGDPQSFTWTVARRYYRDHVGPDVPSVETAGVCRAGDCTVTFEDGTTIGVSWAPGEGTDYHLATADGPNGLWCYKYECPTPSQLELESVKSGHCLLADPFD